MRFETIKAITNQCGIKAEQLLLTSSSRNTRHLKSKLIMEKLSYKKRLAHTAAPINHHKLTAPRVTESLQFTNFCFSSYDLHTPKFDFAAKIAKKWI